MALAVASFTANASYQTDLAAGKSVTVSWSAGDAVIVFAAVETDSRNLVAPTATGLTFTQLSLIDGTTGNECAAGMWGAIAGASGSSVTVTASCSGAAANGCIVVWVISGGPSSLTAVTGNTTESGLSIATGAGDVVCYGLADWNATNPPGKTPATGSGTATERADQGNGSNYGVYIADWVGTTAGTTTYGPNNYTSLKVAQVAAVIKAPSGTNASAGSAPVATTAATAAAQLLPAAGSAPVATAAQPAAGQARPAAGVAGVATAAQAATTTVQPAAGSGVATVAAPAPAVTVLAQAGTAAVAVAATDAAASATTGPTNANAGGAAVGVTAAAAEARVPQLKVLQTYALASADPHSITIPGATAGRDVWLIVNTAAVVTTPSGWTSEASHVVDMASYIYRLDGASNPGGSIGVTLDLTAARALSAVAIEARTVAPGTLYASLVAPLNPPGSTAWGTDAHTFTARDDVLAIYAFHTSSTPPTFAASSYDHGFAALADTGWGGAGASGDEATRILVGFAVETGFTADGVVVTLDAAAPNGSAVGFLAFDENQATIASSAPVGATGQPATATVRGPAASAPVATTAPAPLAIVAPLASQGSVTLGGQPATTTVRAGAGAAAIAAQGQAATANTSSSTNANAGAAAVGVTAPAGAAAVRPAATSAPVGTTGQFDPGTVPVLQLVMDNPVGIAVTAANATVTATTGPTNANAGGAPVSLTAQAPAAQGRPGATSSAVSTTAPAPTGQVRAQAGVAAVATTGQAATVSTSASTSANAGVAAVGVQASAPAATARPAAAVAAVSAAGLGPSVQVGNQVLAQAAVAAVSTAAPSTTSAVRPSASEAACSTAGLASLAPVRPAAGAAVAAVSAAGPLVRIGLRPTTATIIALAFTAIGGPSSPTYTGGLNMLLQIQTLTKVRPAKTTDAYGNTVLDYGPAATRTTLPGWVWQASRREGRPDGRGPAEQVWELMCNEPDLDTDDRIEWSSGNPAGPLVFAIEGPPQPSYRAGNVAGAQGFHHTEATMRLVEG